MSLFASVLWLCAGTFQSAPQFIDVASRVDLAEDTPTFSIATGDLDRDLRPDLVISRHGGRPRVWMNRIGGFVDVAPSSGFLAGDCHGVTIADLVPDRYPEIYVTKGACRGTCTSPNDLYWNRRGSFVHLAGSAFDDPLGRGRSATPFDVDVDGMLDLFVTNFNDGLWSRTRYFVFDPRAPQLYRDDAEANGIDRLHSSSVSVLDLDDDGTRYALFDGTGVDAGRIFELDRVGRMTEVTARMGLDLPDRWTIQQIAPLDYDSDGDLDLYFVRAHGNRDFFALRGRTLYFRSYEPDAALRVADSGRFRIEVRIDGEPAPQQVFLGGGRARSRSNAVAATPALLQGTPVLGPSDSGVFVWHANGELHLRAVRAGSVVTAVIVLQQPSRYVSTGLIPRPRYSNLLFRNDGGHFVDVTAAAHLEDAADSSSALAEDFDNDGDLDLFVVNRGDDVTNEPDCLYLNQDDGTFVEVAAQVGLRGATYGRGDGAAALDFDRDGDLDLCVTNGWSDWPNDRGPIQLFRNELATRNGANLHLLGSTANTLALGARIRIRRPDGRIQYRFRGGMTAHLSHGSPSIHVGLGAAAYARVTVQFPAGAVRNAYPRAMEDRFVRE